MSRPGLPGDPAGASAPYRVFNLHGAWMAEVDGQLQSPTWNSKGAAEAFAQAVVAGKRKAEPCKLFK